MMFSEIILILFLVSNVVSFTRPREIMEDIFYGDSPINKKSEFIKLKEQIEKTKSENIPISHIKFYHSTNLTNFRSLKKITKTQGNCSYFLSLKNSLSHTSNFSENIKNLKAILNDKNYLFNDEEGNLIVYSTCTNFIDLSCTPQFIFISKLDFSFFKYSLSNEVLEFLSNSAIDMISDRFQTKQIFYLFGGIDRSGIHNENLYKFVLDNTFGKVKVQKMGTKSLIKPAGRAESSLNIINYNNNPLSKNPSMELIVVFGGVNDIKTLNELWIYQSSTSTWTSIENKREPLLPRKGHSAVVFYNNTDGNINQEIMRTYNIIIFGGKNDFGYIGDIFIIDITYMVLEDKFFYKFRTIDTSNLDDPEKREGHKSLIKDDYMYIFGGCNYEIKKCYQDAYRINLKTMEDWEKIDYNVNKEVQDNYVRINPEHSFFTEYMGEILTLSYCKDEECVNKDPTLLILDSECKKDSCYKMLKYRYDLKIEKDLGDNNLGGLKQKKKKNDSEKSLKTIYKTVFHNSKLVCEDPKKMLPVKVLIPVKPKVATKPKNNKNKTDNKSNKAKSNDKKKNVGKDKNHKKDEDHNKKKDKGHKKDKKHRKDKDHYKDKKKKRFNEEKNFSHMENKSENYPLRDKNNEINKESLQIILEIMKKMNSTELILNGNNKMNLMNKNKSFMNDIGFLSINDKVKEKELKDKEKEIEKEIEHKKELNSISKTLEDLKTNIKKLERSYVNKRNTDENTRKNIINSNYMLVSNIEKTNNISDNLLNFESYLYNYEKNFTQRFENKFQGLYSKLSEFDKIKEGIQKLQQMRRNEITVNEKIRNCTNGEFKRREGKCKCFTGFTGQNCEFPKNCTNNCSNNGICTLGKCYCNPDFGGEICEKRLKCHKNCSKKGTCRYGKCYCDPGFAGRDCSIKLKCPNNCNNRGICFRQKCLCSPGWGGQDCSILNIESKPCYNDCYGNGKCVNDKCFCNPDFRGKFCNIKIEFNCPPFLTEDKINKNTTWAPCNNNGICKYGTCYCFPGFKGDDCSIKEVCINNCSYNGICIKGKCLCKESFSGNDCSINEKEKSINSKPKKKSFKRLDKEKEFISFAQINETILPKNEMNSIISNKFHSYRNENLLIKISLTMIVILIPIVLFFILIFLLCNSKN